MIELLFSEWLACLALQVAEAANFYVGDGNGLNVGVAQLKLLVANVTQSPCN